MQRKTGKIHSLHHNWTGITLLPLPGLTMLGLMNLTYLELLNLFSTCVVSSSRKLKLVRYLQRQSVSVLAKLIHNLPPTVENCPNESSEATLMPLSRVVTCVTWSCRFCQTAPQTMSSGGAGMLGRGSLSGGIAPLLRSLCCRARLQVLLSDWTDLQPWKIGTKLRPAIISSLHRGRKYLTAAVLQKTLCVIYKTAKCIYRHLLRAEGVSRRALKKKKNGIL